MTIRVANEPVQLGDRLFSRRAATWGNVVQVLDSAVVLTITKGSTARNYTVTDGGLVAGSRDIFWHSPLDLDLPKSQMSKLSKLQTVVDTVREVL